MSYLIDGYNLLFALGTLSRTSEPATLQQARSALLRLLRSAYGDDRPQITVVFDAGHARPGASEIHYQDGIQVRFAVHGEEADDLIETLIEHESTPRKLTVVSNDRRLQQAARRGGCHALGCGEYMDLLLKLREVRRPQASESTTKPESLSRQEVQHWLKEFSDQELDRDLKEISEPLEWLEDLENG